MVKRSSNRAISSTRLRSRLAPASTTFRYPTRRARRASSVKPAALSRRTSDRSTTARPSIASSARQAVAAVKTSISPRRTTVGMPVVRPMLCPAAVPPGGRPSERDASRCRAIPTSMGRPLHRVCTLDRMASRDGTSVRRRTDAIAPAAYDLVVMTNASALPSAAASAAAERASRASFAEVVLERLLGKVRAEYADGGDGTRARRTLAWNCGCLATECDPPWFRLISCLQHRGDAA
jgi:hypothetical protein